MLLKSIAKLILGFFILSIFFNFGLLNIAQASWVKMNNNTGADNVSNDGHATGMLPLANDFSLDSSSIPYIVWEYDLEDEDGNYLEEDVFFSKWTSNACGVNGCWTKMDGTAGHDNLSGAVVYWTMFPRIKVGTDNIPYVFWEYHNDIYFSKWTVGAGPSVCGMGINDCWTNMAGTVSGNENISNSGGISWPFSVELNANNAPYLTWGDGSEGQNIFFTHWDGTKWAKMSGTLGTDNITNYTSPGWPQAHYPELKIGSNGNPYILWLDDLDSNVGGNKDVRFVQWTSGVGWTKMDGTLGTDNIKDHDSNASGLNFQLDSNNIPYVTWNDYDYSSGDAAVYIRKWSGSAWTKMDGSSGSDIFTSASYSYSPLIQLDSSDHPFVLWIEGGNDLYITKWSNTDWVKMDGTSGLDVINNSASFGNPYFKLDTNGRPNISWVNGGTDMYFTKWSGTNWVKMDGNPGMDNVTNTGTASVYLMALDSSNNPNFSGFDYLTSDIYFTKWGTFGLAPLTGEVNITAEVEPSLTLTLTSTACDLGSFDSVNLKTCSYGAEVSTNGSAGYIALIKSDGNLRNATNSIANVSGGSVEAATESYGLATTKSSQTISQINDADSDTFYTQADCTALKNQASTAMTASALTTSDQTFASSSGPVASDTAYLCHAVAITGTTPAGVYAQLVTITVIGNF
ncbi:MAG: hypothetical protein NTX00_04400 [Candidatus Parcubacteria bacterium]|nr:hypothetical protein [Candidatus Parcubacteria bacterium]